MARFASGPNAFGTRLFEYQRQGLDVNAPAVSEVPTYAGNRLTGAAPLPLPDTSAVMQSGRVVSVTPENYARSFVAPAMQGGKEIGGGQGLFIHPQTGKWVPFAQLPVGADGLRQSLGQQDGNPYVNRSGFIDVAHQKSESPWVEFRNSVAPVLAATAPIAAAAALPAAAASAGLSSTAATPQIGAGIFSGGLEAAAAGAPAGGFLGGGSGALGFGGAGAATAGAGASTIPALAGGTISGGGMAGGSLSGIMSWLGSPTGQAVSQLGSAALQGVAAQRAGQAQAGAAQAGIDEQRRQFEAMQAGLAPYQQAGTQALGGFAPYQQAGAQAFQQQQALAGLQGQPAQQEAIGALEQSPIYQALARQGEEAMLQRASATGGLRGGNIQGALAQFRPALLQQLIDQQYARLGGLAGTGLGVTQALAGMGQSAAAMQGQGGMNAASNIGNLLAQQGQSQAGGILGIGRGLAQAFNVPGQIQEQQRADDMAAAMRRVFGVK